MTAMPQFSDDEFESEDPKVDNVDRSIDDRRGSAAHTISLDVGGGEVLEIVNHREQLPEASSTKDRLAFVRATAAAELLDEDGRHAAARALVDPAVAGSLVKGGLTTTETVEMADLTHVSGHSFLSELFPLLQPRTESEYLTVAPPYQRGVLDEAGRPKAIITLRFRNVQHLVNYMRQTITHTRESSNNYAPSILSRRVGRQMLVHVVRLEFEDGTESFEVVAVRDGITRLVSAWAARIGGKPSGDEVAHTMIEHLMRTVPPRAGKAPNANQDHARGRELSRSEDRTKFAAGTTGTTPDETAVRIGQTYTVPVQFYLGVAAAPTATVPEHEVFPEAMRAVVAAIHTEFRPWDPAAQAVDVAGRALQRCRYRGDLADDVVDLALGIRGPQETPNVFGDGTIPGTPLWRAVYLVHAFTQAATFDRVKVQLKAVLGMTAIRNKRFLGYVGPIVDQPWRGAKSRTLLQSRRAWSAGSPIPWTLLGTYWEPVPTDDFMSLVPRALSGDRNALRTLQIAGGIALVADRLLGSNVGSVVDAGLVPFRADPQDVVASLGSVENVPGLYQLARAAEAFSAEAPARNSLRDRDFKDPGRAPEVTYVVPAVDPDNPSAILLDGTGQPKALTAYELVRLSDPARASREAARRTQTDQSGYNMPQSVAERAKAMRDELASGLKATDDTLRSLLRIVEEDPAVAGPALGTHDEWVQMSAVAHRVSSRITVNEPPEDGDGEDETDQVDLDELDEQGDHEEADEE